MSMQTIELPSPAAPPPPAAAPRPADGAGGHRAGRLDHRRDRDARSGAVPVGAAGRRLRQRVLRCGAGRREEPEGLLLRLARPGSFITVDKPPAALCVQELWARVFGFSPLSILLPEAAAGVASVLVLHRMVRRWAGDLAAHLASLALALTPVAVLMFRFNNPDALLTLLCLLAALALWSAVETGRTRCLLTAGALVGLAFDTKMLQALLVMPAFRPRLPGGRAAPPRPADPPAPGSGGRAHRVGRLVGHRRRPVAGRHPALHREHD